MIVTTAKCDKDAELKIIIGDFTRMSCSINGFCSQDINAAIESLHDYIKKTGNIVTLKVVECGDEYEVFEFMKKMEKEQRSERKSDVTTPSQPGPYNTEDDDRDFDFMEKVEKQQEDQVVSYICPICKCKKGLMDSTGKIFPCLNCIKIDIGQKLQRKKEKDNE